MRVETHEVVKDGFLWKTVDCYPQSQEETEFLRGFSTMAGDDASVAGLSNDGVSFGTVVMAPIPDVEVGSKTQIRHSYSGE